MGFITWTELEALAFGGDVVRAGRDEERQLEELVALGIDVDAAAPATELLQVFDAQDFANHFSHCVLESLLSSICVCVSFDSTWSVALILLLFCCFILIFGL